MLPDDILDDFGVVSHTHTPSQLHHFLENGVVVWHSYDAINLQYHTHPVEFCLVALRDFAKRFV